MQYKKKIFVIAGELSGDQIGGLILDKLKKNNNEFELHGVGGKNLIKLGLNSIFDMEKISLMGLIEIIPNIFKILRLIKITTEHIIKVKPDIILTIDAPGFNFRVLKKLRKYNTSIPNIHIVAPTVWAWKPGRAKKISEYIDYLFVLYPFEKKYFIPYGIKTHFIGHPLVELNLHNKNTIKKNDNIYISIFPGSRKNEINRHLKKILCYLVNSNIKYDFVIVAVEKHFKLINFIANKYKSKLSIKIVPSSDKKEVFKNSLAAIAVSGTITLELALNKVPFLTVYRLNYFTYLLLKNIVFAKYITLVNILFNKLIVTELIQNNFNKYNLQFHLLSIINKSNTYKNQICYFNKLEELLKNKKTLPSMYASLVLEKILYNNNL